MMDAQALAPPQQVRDVFGADLVTDAGIGETGLTGPATIAVHDHADVIGQPVLLTVPDQPVPEPSGVRPLRGMTQNGGRPRREARTAA
jgi:hypothetical protein